MVIRRIAGASLFDIAIYQVIFLFNIVNHYGNEFVGFINSLTITNPS